MVTEVLKSQAITNLDAASIQEPTAGEYGPSPLLSAIGIVSPTDGKTVGSTYLMVRLPTSAKLKHIFVGQSVVATAFVADIGMYYSDSTTDGTAKANQGIVLNTDLQDFFAVAKDFDAALLNAPPTEVTFLNPAEGYLMADTVLPLWNATNSGLTADPGGFFDIVLTTVSETNSVPGTVWLEVQYCK
jgi:hypothetical protein